MKNLIILLLPLLIAFSFAPHAANKALAQKQIVYAALYDEGNLAVVDPAAGKLIRRIQVGRNPDCVALNSDNTKLYVSNTGEISVSIVSLEESRVTQVLRLPVNRRNIYAGPMVRTPDGTKIFVAERAESDEELRIYVIDTQKELIVGQFNAGKNISALSVSFDGRKLFVVNKCEAIGVYDTETNQKIGVVPLLPDVAKDVFAIACSPASAKACISYGPRNKVQIINTDTYSTEAEIAVPKYKTGSQKGIYFSGNGKYAFIINHKVDLKEIDGVNVIDISKNEIIKIFNSGIVHRGMTTSSDNLTFYVAATDLLKWYNVLTLEHIRSISLRTTIHGIAVVEKM